MQLIASNAPEEAKKGLLVIYEKESNFIVISRFLTHALIKLVKKNENKTSWDVHFTLLINKFKKHAVYTAPLGSNTYSNYTHSVQKIKNKKIYTH